MYKLLLLTFYAILISSVIPAFAENVYNDFGYWNKANVLVPLNDRFKFNLDTQYKYQKDIGNSFVLRPSLGIDLPKGFSFWNGYAYYNYGEGSEIFENRIWQQIQHEKEFSKLNLVNRFRLEERFFQNVGKQDNVGIRGRYLIRSMFPVGKKKSWFLVLSDEVLFNFNDALYGFVNDGYEGNRLFAGINHKFNDYISAELGYQLEHLNPGTLKASVGGFSIKLDPPQYLNHGLLFNAYFTTPQIFNRDKKPLTTQPAF